MPNCVQEDSDQNVQLRSQRSRRRLFSGFFAKPHTKFAPLLLMKCRSCRLIPPQQHHLVKQIQDELRINHADALRKGQINTLITTSQSHRLRRSIYHTSTDTFLIKTLSEKIFQIPTTYIAKHLNLLVHYYCILQQVHVLLLNLKHKFHSPKFPYFTAFFTLHCHATTQAKGSFYAQKKINPLILFDDNRAPLKSAYP